MKYLSIIFTSFLTLTLTILYAQDAKLEYSRSSIGVGVIVEDLDESLAFYTDVLGMTRSGSLSLDEKFGKSSGLSGGVPVEIAVLKLIDEEGASDWKLMTFNTEASHPKQTHIQDDTGMQYITLFVNSLAAFIDRLEKHEVQMLGDTPVELSGGRHFVLIQDPDGNFIELIGPM